ncbi:MULTISPECIES: heterocyst-inhibiting signaling peptide PatS [Nostoc]
MKAVMLVNFFDERGSGR